MSGIQKTGEQLGTPGLLRRSFVQAELQQDVEVLSIDVIFLNICFATTVTLGWRSEIAQTLQQAYGLFFCAHRFQFECETLAEVELVEADIRLTAELLDEVEGKLLNQLPLAWH